MTLKFFVFLTEHFKSFHQVQKMKHYTTVSMWISYPVTFNIEFEHPLYLLHSAEDYTKLPCLAYREARNPTEVLVILYSCEFRPTLAVTAKCILLVTVSYYAEVWEATEKKNKEKECEIGWKC